MRIYIDTETGEQKEIQGELTPEILVLTEDMKQKMDMEFLKGFEATIEAKPLSYLRMKWAFGIFPPGVPIAWEWQRFRKVHRRYKGVER